ncbi:MAG: DUF2787 family protein [Vibrio hibernica]
MTTSLTTTSPPSSDGPAFTFIHQPQLPLPFNQCLSLLLAHLTLPTQASRCSLHCRNMEYYSSGQGVHPVEIRLERSSKYPQAWQLVFIASFAYEAKGDKALTPELYFNLKNAWFYQPDIQDCELDRPEVLRLLNSWSLAFCRHLQQQKFNNISISEVRLPTPTTKRNHDE